MLQLGEVDVAIAGGVSESIHTFGIFATARCTYPEVKSSQFSRCTSGSVLRGVHCL